MCMEQTRALADLAEQARRARGGRDRQLAALGELLQKLVQDRDAAELSGEGARSLLSAIEARPTLERRIGDALTDLLQSEDLKERIVSATAASVQELVRARCGAEVSALFVPAVERAHRQLLRHVTKLVAAAFADLEESMAGNVEAFRESSATLLAELRAQRAQLAAAADRVAAAVAGTTERVFEQELQRWREETRASECDSGGVASPGAERAAPERAGERELSAVDRMMMKAEIQKLMREGDANGAFSRALLALDLGLVGEACRAAPPAPALAPPVLLSLLQQLAADLLMDTPLKCSYIEYALQALDPSEPVARAHLPRVLADLQRHISAFLREYPRHALAQRIYKIYETARSLL